MGKKHDSSNEREKIYKNEETATEKNPETNPESSAAQSAEANIVNEAAESKSEPKAEKAAESKSEPAAEKQKADSTEELLAAERDKYLRLLAEYDNYRKRSAKERESIYSEVRADTALRFLPVYDNLERALQNETEDEAYKRGVEMIMTQFLETLKEFGITPIEALNGKFDPTLHEAIMHEVNEEKGENEVVYEFKKGFKQGDKVIRFSVVKVAN